MTTFRTLYSETGDIKDINTLLVNRAELRALIVQVAKNMLPRIPEQSEAEWDRMAEIALRDAQVGKDADEAAYYCVKSLKRSKEALL